jgi:hypothetical protein
MQIILIHGLHGSVYPLMELQLILESNDYFVSVFSYESTVLTLEQAAEQLESVIDQYQEVILIAHSAGGRIAVLIENPKVIGIITVASPLRGSLMASLFGFRFYSGPMVQQLVYPHTKPIYIPLVTITTNYYGSFDGRVFRSEMDIEGSHHTVHVDGTWHSGKQLVEPRIVEEIMNAIQYLLDLDRLKYLEYTSDHDDMFR